jgi:periplasmic divalent cation tolerance protein
MRDIMSARLAPVRAASVLPVCRRSVYNWQGQIEDRSEAHVVLHTKINLVPAIVAETKKEHPYIVPCVVAKPITAGNPDYIQWILDETQGRPPL